MNADSLQTAALPVGYRMAELPAGDRDALIELSTWAFASSRQEEERIRAGYALEPGRVVGVWAPDRTLAAGHASYRFGRFGVPGGTLPAAGLTWVSVHPQHRRRGLARAMVGAHLARTAVRGEPLSVLFASEPTIYGRFGYAPASRHVTLRLSHGQELRGVPGTDELQVHIETADPAQHGPVVGSLHDAVTRPGWARRETHALATGVFADDLSHPSGDAASGSEPLRIAWVSDTAGNPRAYALFTRKMHATARWHPDGTVKVREAVALDGAAARALWAFLIDLDLMGSVITPMLAVDDPLLTLLADPRAAERTSVDNVWVRLVDLPAALRGRAYAAGVDVVLEVTDDQLPANSGRWRLTAGPDGTEVTPSTASPDLALGTAELASAYLGGVSLASLGAAGLVQEETPGALAACSTAFGWPEAPVTSWIF